MSLSTFLCIKKKINCNKLLYIFTKNRNINMQLLSKDLFIKG